MAAPEPASGSETASRADPDANTLALPQPERESAASDPFGIDAEVLLGDIRAAVTEYCAEGFDALERCLASDLPTASDEQQQGVAQGTEALYQAVSARLEEQLQLFEGHALQGCLYIPPGLELRQQPARNSDSDVAADAAAEAALRSELATLQTAIQRARSDMRKMQVQLAAMERDLAANGDKSDLEAVVGPAAGKENIVSDARAIAADAAKLRPLLVKGERLQMAQAARGVRLSGSVAAADRELRRRGRLHGGGMTEGIDPKMLLQANQLMAAHSSAQQGRTPVEVDRA